MLFNIDFHVKVFAFLFFVFFLALSNYPFEGDGGISLVLGYYIIITVPIAFVFVVARIYMLKIGLDVKENCLIVTPYYFRRYIPLDEITNFEIQDNGFYAPKIFIHTYGKSRRIYSEALDGGFKACREYLRNLDIEEIDNRKPKPDRHNS